MSLQSIPKMNIRKRAKDTRINQILPLFSSYPFKFSISKDQLEINFYSRHNHRKDIDCCYAGDIAAVVGLKNTTTGDTLCDENQDRKSVV